MQGGDLCDEMFKRNPQGIHPVRAKNIMAQLVSNLVRDLFVNSEHHTGVWLLRRVLKKIWECQRLALFHRSLRLSSPYSINR